jgi:hypothetical protein
MLRPNYLVLYPIEGKIIDIVDEWNNVDSVSITARFEGFLLSKREQESEEAN